eukprot:564275-Prorocentrum_lima.AAC.1
MTSSLVGLGDVYKRQWESCDFGVRKSVLLVGKRVLPVGRLSLLAGKLFVLVGSATVIAGK